MTPLNSNFSSVAQLLQFVEVNGVFGADQFIFYNYSSSDVLNPYFDYYVSSGKAKVIQWRLPVSASDVHYFAQVVSLNDCVLRAMLTSRYVASLDLDEVLLPLAAPDWWSLIQQQNGGDDNSTAGWLFANTFFVPDTSNPRFENHALMKQHPIPSYWFWMPPRVRMPLAKYRHSKMWPTLPAVGPKRPRCCSMSMPARRSSWA